VSHGRCVLEEDERERVRRRIASHRIASRRHAVSEFVWGRIRHNVEVGYDCGWLMADGWWLAGA